jgi:hypothetical protein
MCTRDMGVCEPADTGWLPSSAARAISWCLVRKSILARP